MSRIGNNPISIPEGVSVEIQPTLFTVKGKLGELYEIIGGITVKMDGNEITFDRPSDAKEHKAKHGLYRSLVSNMVIGVSEGYTKTLELIGVGYRATNQGQVLDLSLGYSHNFLMSIPKEVKVSEKERSSLN